MSAPPPSTHGPHDPHRSADASPAADPLKLPTGPLQLPTGSTPSGPLFPIESWTAPFRVTDSQEDDRLRLMTFAAHPDGSLTMDRLGIRTEHLFRAEDGRIMLRAIDNLEHNVTVTLAQPLCVLPAMLDARTHSAGRSKVIVTDRTTGRLRDRGEIGIVVVYEGRQTVTTDLGRFDCHRVRIDCDARFGLGRSISTTVCYFSPGIGLVAEEYESRTTILILTQTRRLAAARSVKAVADVAAP
jgi:hypothetical protein